MQPAHPAAELAHARDSGEQEPGEDAEVALPPRLDLLAGAGLLQIAHPRARTLPRAPRAHTHPCTYTDARATVKRVTAPEKTERASL